MKQLQHLLQVAAVPKNKKQNPTNWLQCIHAELLTHDTNSNNYETNKSNDKYLTTHKCYSIQEIWANAHEMHESL